MISDEKILITGASGMVGTEAAKFLAENNEVWGIARFEDKAKRAELESAGVKTRAIDLGSGDFSELPSDFTYLLHLSWFRADLSQLQDAIRTNVEGAGLILQHCRKAKAALVMSGMGIYTGNPDPWHEYTETDPVGRGATAYAPTSPASKLGVESVARFCARAFNLPIVITRFNSFDGPLDAFPGKHIQAVLTGQPMVAPCDPNPHRPIHSDDMKEQLEAMLDAAGTPALITNWCGDDVVTAQEWMQWTSELSGKKAELIIKSFPGAPAGTNADARRRRSITGPCRVTARDSFQRKYDVLAARSGVTARL